MSTPRWRGTVAATAVLLAATAAPGQVEPKPPPLRAAPGSDAAAVSLTGDIVPAHDPVLMEERGIYYVYSTGQRERMPIAMRYSTDLVHWTPGPSPIARLPDWAVRAVPGATGIWAPDISRVGNGYRLYYAVSTFGAQRSAIGLLTAATLDPAAPGYGWRDKGLVLASAPGGDFNAIDPNFVRDREGGQWLAFGSFWGGIMLVALDPATGKPRAAGAAPIALARRPGGQVDAIEAAFVVDHGGWYWLIASFDQCCRGAASTYYTVVGRSRAIAGPYADRAGQPMLAGGGTVLARAGPADRFRGTGHAGFLHASDGRDWLVYHAYDREEHGAPTLRLSRVRWGADGWPFLSPDAKD